MPPRRSRRLASREPEEAPALINASADQTRDLRARTREVDTDLEQKREQVDRAETDARVERSIKAPSPAPQPQHPTLDGEPQTASTPPPAPDALATLKSASPPQTLPEEQRATTPAPRWRQMVDSIGGYLSPFRRRAPQANQPVAEIGDRKRAASDEDHDNVPTPKRVRTHEPQSSTEQSTSSSRQASEQEQTQNTPAIHEPPASPLAERSAASRRQMQKQSHLRHVQSASELENPASSTLGELTSTSRKRTAPIEEQRDTPMPQRSPSPHKFLMRSTRDPRVSPSLSTVPEYTEQSALTRFGENSFVHDDTPPAPALSTPTRMPRRRTIKEVRQMHQFGQQTPEPSSYAWERSRARARAATHKPEPVEKNADMRYDKMERLRALKLEMEQKKREVEQLEKDADVVEMQSHRRKRVKVDNLVAIPHNKPGESQGTFRVPDWDSDDEMEVEETAEERVNIFEQAHEQQRNDQVSERAQVQVQVQVQEHKREQQQEHVEPRTSQWTFPSLGKRRPDQAISAEEEERCRIKFVTGFEAYRKNYGLA